jgi:hypothetical protein
MPSNVLGRQAVGVSKLKTGPESCHDLSPVPKAVGVTAPSGLEKAASRRDA